MYKLLYRAPPLSSLLPMPEFFWVWFQISEKGGKKANYPREVRGPIIANGKISRDSHLVSSHFKNRLLKPSKEKLNCFKLVDILEEPPSELEVCSAQPGKCYTKKKNIQRG